MSAPLVSIAIRHEQDVVAARRRSRRIAEMLGFDRIDQTRVATAVSEIARNAYQYAGGGRVDFALDGHTAPQLLVIRVSDHGPGIPHLDDVLAGRYRSQTGLGFGISGAGRLMDRFEMDAAPGGTTVTMAKLLPHTSRCFEPADLGRIAEVLAAERFDGPLEEVQQQNHELVRALDALRLRQEELERVNRELEDTNRGVVALYAELDERADHLRRADELKTKFLSNMTHEFRTPVNSILALSRLLAERLGTGDHEKDELFYLQRSAQQLSDLVDDLLDIAKVEAGKIDVRPSLFEVRGLFGALRGMLRPLLTSQAVTLTFDEDDSLPPVYSDETKVSQVLRNFVSNALKYTESGEVRVTAAFDRDRSEMAFTVTDTGIGIPEADLPRIFDEFAQIENPLQRRVKGTGNGLPLCRRLADLLRGRVTVRSRLAEGSAFTLTIPIMFRDPIPITAPEIPDGKVPVLVVEDSDEDSLIYQRLLAGTPYQAVVATSIQAATQLLQRVTPAAVILDVHLRDREAWDLLVSLRRERATASLPVIVVSVEDHHRKALGLGATAFGLKPVSGDWLLRMLDTGRRSAPTRVLAVDDEEAFRFIVREILSGPQYQLAEASSVDEALAAIRTFDPAVVLLDLNLPDRNGAELAAMLAADPGTAHLPIVAVTSLRLTPERLEALAGVRRIIPKATLSRDLLRSAIREAVQVAPAR